MIEALHVRVRPVPRAITALPSHVKSPGTAMLGILTTTYTTAAKLQPVTRQLVHEVTSWQLSHQ